MCNNSNRSRLFTTVLSTRLLEVLWSLFNPSVSRDSSTPAMQAKSAHPDVCSENSSLYNNMKKSCGQRGNGATIEDRGGICWHCIKCNAEVFEAQRGQVFVSQCFLCFCCLQLKQQKPHWDSLPFFFLFFFFAPNQHTKLPVLGCNCPVQRKTTSLLLSMHLFQVIPAERGSRALCWRVLHFFLTAVIYFFSLIQLYSSNMSKLLS